jgi:NADPH-dependent 2,4-dienoyl-CoA reductase/sulfur reductase-like enzyme
LSEASPAAARLRRVSETAEIVLVERGPYISFANCGLPYHISGAISEREQLLVTSELLFESRYRVDVRSHTEALAIDRVAKTVRLRNLETGVETDERYDRLLLAPGAEVVRPRRISGIDSKRIFTLHNIPDLDRIMAALGESRPRRALVIGGGYIGLEVAENFHERGLFTTVVEGAPHILAPFDEEMAAIVRAHMRDKAIELYLDDKIEHFEDRPDHVVVFLASGKRIQVDIVVLSIGVRPEAKLVREAELALGATGGVKVDEDLATSDPDIYAVGGAIEVTHFVSGKSTLIPLAGPANRQARIVADNMLASDPAARKRYGGTMGTAILKAFDLTAACTGLFFSTERTRAPLAGRREGLGNVAAAGLGVVTPFCSCPAAPPFVGFVSAGVPLGVTLSLLIAAPMVNEVALGLLFALVGWAAFGVDIACRHIAFELPSNEAICDAVAADAGLAAMSRLVVDATIKAGELRRADQDGDRAVYAVSKRIACAPSQSVSLPSAARFSRPEVRVMKWLPAS